MGRNPSVFEHCYVFFIIIILGLFIFVSLDFILAWFNFLVKFVYLFLFDDRFWVWRRFQSKLFHDLVVRQFWQWRRQNFKKWQTYRLKIIEIAFHFHMNQVIWTRTTLDIAETMDTCLQNCKCNLGTIYLPFTSFYLLLYTGDNLDFRLR